MTKYKIKITHTEVYTSDVIVEAESAEDARLKVEHEWGEGNGLFEDVTDGGWDNTTEFTYTNDGLATNEDIKTCLHLSDYTNVDDRSEKPWGYGKHFD